MLVVLQDFALRLNELKRLLCHNSQVRSLKLDCGRLDDKALDFILKPHLEEIHLLNCERFSSRLLLEIGQCCPGLRYHFSAILSFLPMNWKDCCKSCVLSSKEKNSLITSYFANNVMLLAGWVVCGLWFPFLSFLFCLTCFEFLANVLEANWWHFLLSLGQILLWAISESVNSC